MNARKLVETLTLPYQCLKTLHYGASEVRRYQNELTGLEQVGKRIDVMGLENAVAVREATLLQTLAHDNLVRVFDVVRVADPAYDPAMRVIELIMPFFKRGSVCDALLRGERFTVVESTLLTQAALRGLGELHERHRILHRDVKSGNVFLADDGSLLKVGDLGIAVPMHDDGTADAYPGAQIYTPPEMLVTKKVDRRSDIYGAGLLFFELLNGPFPYEEYRTTKDFVSRLQKGRSAVRPRDLVPRPHVPKRLRTVLRKATALDPMDRYATASEMAAAIAGARVIDWRPPKITETAIEWEGAASWRPDRSYRVVANRRKSGAWRLSALQVVAQPRRLLYDVDVTDPFGSDATAFFDQVLSAATS